MFFPPYIWWFIFFGARWYLWTLVWSWFHWQPVHMSVVPIAIRWDFWVQLSFHILVAVLGILLDFLQHIGFYINEWEWSSSIFYSHPLLYPICCFKSSKNTENSNQDMEAALPRWEPRSSSTLVQTASETRTAPVLTVKRRIAMMVENLNQNKSLL